MSNNYINSSASPLAHTNLAQLAKQHSNVTAGINFRELMLLGHLILRGNANDPAFLNGAQQSLQFALPLTPCSSNKNSDYLVFWLSPNEWLIICQQETLAQLTAQLTDNLVGHYALVDVSSAQTIIELSGDEVINLLKKSTSYNTNPDHFTIGKVVTTTFAQTSATIYKAESQRFLLVTRRSFTDYIWMWIQQTSQEYGLKILTPTKALE